MKNKCPVIKKLNNCKIIYVCIIDFACLQYGKFVNNLFEKDKIYNSLNKSNVLKISSFIKNFKHNDILFWFSFIISNANNAFFKINFVKIYQKLFNVL